MNRNTVIKIVAALLLVCLVAVPVLVFPPYEPLAVTGPSAIHTARYTYRDEHRSEQYSSSGEHRQVNVAFWYPQPTSGHETYPLIVFSHGGLGLETSNESLYRELASHGYVVCSIGHPYHAFWTKGEDGQLTFVSMDYFQEIQREDARRDKEQSFRYYQAWMETRTADISLAIDTILAQAANGADGVYALVDQSMIGVMGHSLGGSAALALPRQRADIDVVIALEAPFLYDIVGVEGNQFVWTDQPYPAPVLNVYSDSAWDHLSEWAQYGRNNDLISNAPETVANLYLPGRGHFSMTDLSLASPLLVRLLEGGKPTQGSEEYLIALNKVCLDFLDRYLKGREG